MRFTKITIIKTKVTPEQQNINELLQWLGGSLGLFNPRDKDKSCYRIFLMLLKELKQPTNGMTSDELAASTGLSRGTVVHHLNHLIGAGIVSAHRGYYALRVDNLEELVEDIKKSVNKTFDDIKDVATYVDKRLNL